METILKKLIFFPALTIAFLVPLTGSLHAMEKMEKEKEKEVVVEDAEKQLEQYFEAASKGNIETLKTLQDITIRKGKDRLSLLHIAVTSTEATKAKQEETIEYLIKTRGMHPEIVDIHKKSPLQYALNRRVDQQYGQSDSSTAANLAATLISLGARDYDNGELPQDIRDLVGEKRKAQETKEKKDEKIEEGQVANAAYFTAVAQGDIETLKGLKDLAITKGKDELTLLHIAVSSEKIETIKYLIEKRGMGVDSLDRIRRTPLQFAIEKKLYSVAKELIKLGANVQYSCMGGGKSAYALAKASGNTEISEALEKAKKAYEAKGAELNWTPLHFAAAEWDYISNKKVDAKDCRAKDKNGKTPLDIAVQNSGKFGMSKRPFYGVIEPLVAKTQLDDALFQQSMAPWVLYEILSGGDEQFKKKMETIIKNHANKSFAQEQVSAAKKELQELKQAFDKMPKAVQKHLLKELPVDLITYFFPTEQKLNPFEAWLRTELFAWLVTDKNADITVTDRCGNDLLHLACEKGLFGIVKVLIEKKGVNPDNKDASGNTALQTFVKNYGKNVVFGCKDPLDVLKYLVETGHATIDIKSTTGIYAGLHTLEMTENKIAKEYLAKKIAEQAVDSIIKAENKVEATKEFFKKYASEEITENICRELSFYALREGHYNLLFKVTAINPKTLPAEQCITEFAKAIRAGKTKSDSLYSIYSLLYLQFKSDTRRLLNFCTLTSAADAGNLEFIKALMKPENEEIKFIDPKTVDREACEAAAKCAINKGREEIVKYFDETLKISPILTSSEINAIQNSEIKKYQMLKRNKERLKDILKFETFGALQNNLENKQEKIEGETKKALYHYAAWWDICDNKFGLAKAILDNKCTDINYVNAFLSEQYVFGGPTLLSVAIYKQNDTAVTYLIAHGADLKQPFSDALKTIYENTLGIVKKLVEKDNKLLSIPNVNGLLPLRQAVVGYNPQSNGAPTEEGYTQLLEFLFDKTCETTDITINSIDKDGRTIIHAAAACGNLPALKYFVEKVDQDLREFKVNQLDTQGKTALDLVKKEDAAVQKYLQECGAKASDDLPNIKLKKEKAKEKSDVELGIKDFIGEIITEAVKQSEKKEKKQLNSIIDSSKTPVVNRVPSAPPIENNSGNNSSEVKSENNGNQVNVNLYPDLKIKPQNENNGNPASDGNNQEHIAVPINQKKEEIDKSDKTNAVSMEDYFYTVNPAGSTGWSSLFAWVARILHDTACGVFGAIVTKQIMDSYKGVHAQNNKKWLIASAAAMVLAHLGEQATSKKPFTYSQKYLGEKGSIMGLGALAKVGHQLLKVPQKMDPARGVGDKIQK